MSYSLVNYSRIREVFTENPGSSFHPENVCRALDLSYSDVDPVLKDLIVRGVIHMRGKGWYRLGKAGSKLNPDKAKFMQELRLVVQDYQDECGRCGNPSFEGKEIPFGASEILLEEFIKHVEEM